MRKIISAAVAVGLAAVMVAPAGVATAAKAKPVKVGTDPAGDWSQEGDTTVAPIGDALGQDLTAAYIGVADKKTLDFVIELNSLPAIGGWPEVSRYQWSFTVNGKAYELDGKFTNYTRGACDPTGGSCPPPRDPGMQPFLLRGDCGPDPNASNVIVCRELGIVQATFDAAAATITVPVPMKLIKAKAGSRIGPAAAAAGGTITVSPSAFFTYTGGPFDYMNVTKTFKVPGAKKKRK
jgi:hypothetical protein